MYYYTFSLEICSTCSLFWSFLILNCRILFSSDLPVIISLHNEEGTSQFLFLSLPKVSRIKMIIRHNTLHTVAD